MFNAKFLNYSSENEWCFLRIYQIVSLMLKKQVVYKLLFVNRIDSKNPIRRLRISLNQLLRLESHN
jgi:hypothetical protein